MQIQLESAQDAAVLARDRCVILPAAAAYLVRRAAVGAGTVACR